MTCRLTDLEGFVDYLINEEHKKEIRLDELERELASRFNLGKPIPIKERILMMVKMGIIKETRIVGIFKLIGSRWKIIQALGYDPEDEPNNKPTPVAKKVDLKADEEIEDD